MVPLPNGKDLHAVRPRTLKNFRAASLRPFSFIAPAHPRNIQHHLDRRASKLIQIMPAIKSAQPSTALTKSR
jgi:hypothetical protein